MRVPQKKSLASIGFPNYHVTLADQRVRSNETGKQLKMYNGSQYKLCSDGIVHHVTRDTIVNEVIKVPFNSIPPKDKRVLRAEGLDYYYILRDGRIYDVKRNRYRSNTGTGILRVRGEGGWVYLNYAKVYTKYFKDIENGGIDVIPHTEQYDLTDAGCPGYILTATAKIWNVASNKWCGIYETHRTPFGYVGISGKRLKVSTLIDKGIPVTK